LRRPWPNTRLLRGLADDSEIRLSKKDNAGARTAFEKALATDDKYISPYLSLASLDLDENRWTEAADITSQ